VATKLMWDEKFNSFSFTDDLIHEIVSETNRYAHEKLMNCELLPRSIWHRWTDVTEWV